MYWNFSTYLLDLDLFEQYFLTLNNEFELLIFKIKKYVKNIYLNLYYFFLNLSIFLKIILIIKKNMNI